MLIEVLIITKVNEMNSFTFSEALYQLKNGFKLTRSGWNGKDQWIALQVPDEHSKMSLPYIYISTVDKNLVPWLASQTDIMANDWMIYSFKRDKEQLGLSHLDIE